MRTRPVMPGRARPLLPLCLLAALAGPALVPQAGLAKDDDPLRAGSRGLDAPRALFEAYRKALADRAFGAFWEMMSSGMRERIVAGMRADKRRWAEAEDPGAVEPVLGRSYRELCAMPFEPLFRLTWTVKGGEELAADDPAKWRFLEEAKDRPEVVRCWYADARGREDWIEAVKTPAGWQLGASTRNESNARSVLRKLATAQEIFRSCSSCVDRDGDGRFEYGLLAELAGAPCRGGRTWKDPELPAPFRAASRKGFASVSGYCFAVFLPAEDGGGTCLPSGPADPDGSERSYVAYAWPRVAGDTGFRVFALDARGLVLCLETSPYSGEEKPPAWNAALARGAEDPWRQGLDREHWIPAR